MVNICFSEEGQKEQTFSLAEGESLLDCLLRNGIQVSHACRSGLCQSCKLKSHQGLVPKAAQQPLSPQDITENNLLACLCYPKENLTVAPSDTLAKKVMGNVIERDILSGRILRLRLRATVGYRAGQYFNLWRNETIARCYSVASSSLVNNYLEFHIKHIPYGEFSDWAFDNLFAGNEILLQGPMGSCFYPGEKTYSTWAPNFLTRIDYRQPMLLIGVGTGIAPLLGIVKEAVSRGHRGKIFLIHAAKTSNSLYLTNELKTIEAHVKNIEVFCIAHELE